MRRKTLISVIKKSAIFDDYDNTALTVKAIAVKHGVSANSIYRILKFREQVDFN
jgi:transposase-like protein